MPDGLRVQLGKSSVEKQQKSDSPWPPEVWQAALQAFNSGWQMPEPRYPVILTPDGPVSTPERLQELVGLASVPEIKRTHKMHPYKNKYDESYESQGVDICDIGWDELLKLEERTECENSTRVWFQEQKRAAYVVLSLK